MAPSDFQAKRIKGYSELDTKIMCYWLAKNGEDGHSGEDAWLLSIPGAGLGNLKNHTVTEHADGTITVTPSILIVGHENEKHKQVEIHGYLTAGVWRNC